MRTKRQPLPKTPLSEFERELARHIGAHTTFRVGSGPKRFIRDICAGYIQQLTPRGRWYLAFVAKRFRRQYTLTEDQWAWVNARLSENPPEGPMGVVLDPPPACETHKPLAPSKELFTSEQGSLWP